MPVSCFWNSLVHGAFASPPVILCCWSPDLSRRKMPCDVFASFEKQQKLLEGHYGLSPLEAFDTEGR